MPSPNFNLRKVIGVSSEMLDTLVYWVHERESIRLLKEAGFEKPWTRDAVLQSYRFCNVNREHDKVTRWIRENITDLYWGEDLWFNLVIARMFNLPRTLDHVGYQTAELFRAEDFIDSVSELQDKGVKVFNQAYMVTTHGQKIPKVEFIAKTTLQPIADYVVKEGMVLITTLQEWVLFLCSFTGISTFLANQIVTDLKYTPQLLDALDWSDYVAAGPGTVRGLNRIYKRKLTCTLPDECALAQLQAARMVLDKEVPEMYEYWTDLNNVANCLCEFDKYVRTSNKEGKPKQLYKGA